MKSFIMKGVFVLTALGLIPASAIVGNMSPANAQANAPDTYYDTSKISCDESWLKAALTRFGAQVNGIKYTGNVDKDSATAMMLITTANLRASQYASKCGSSDAMKSMAAKQSAAQIQQLQSLKAMQATMGGA